MNYSIKEKTLRDIAEAIRAKGKTAEPIAVSGMASAINQLPCGNVSQPPHETLTISGDARNYFNDTTHKWIGENFANSMTTEQITNANGMLSGFPLDTVPFDINIQYDVNNTDLGSLLANNVTVKEAPLIRASGLDNITDKKLERVNLNIFNEARNLISIPYNFFDVLFPAGEIEKLAQKTAIFTAPNKGMQADKMFYNCESLTALPDITGLTAFTETTVDNCFYKHPVEGCNSLTAVDLPIITKSRALSLELEGGSVPELHNQYRINAPKLEHITFDKNRKHFKADSVNWSGSSFIITGGEKYNKESVIETFNSLPKVNKGVNSLHIDNRLLEQLQPQEIAIATGKGWTVTA